MSLTLGTGPFGHDPAGIFEPELPGTAMVFIEPYPRRMRGILAGETVVDSTRGQLLHEPGRLPRCFFPPGDVRMDLLEPGAAGKPSAVLGERQGWALRLGDRFVERAALAYPAPSPRAAPIRGLIALYWGAMDEWYEEDDLAIGHVRDPYHRVDALPSSRHVRVSVDGVTVAESHRATVIYETGLGPRWYFPRGDVLAPLAPADFTSRCAYKGEASYWSVLVGDESYENLAWTYPAPRRDAEPVRDLVAFFNEQVDLDVDGVREVRPGGPWADPAWWRDKTFENDL
jgi:uncharacterized protein (DUF427 family)